MASIFRTCFRCSVQVRFMREQDVPYVVFCVNCEVERKDDPAWATVDPWAGERIAREGLDGDMEGTGEEGPKGAVSGDAPDKAPGRRHAAGTPK